jgi:hypothetical protein
MAFNAAPLPYCPNVSLPHTLLPASLARPVNLKAVSPYLETPTYFGHPLQIQGTLLELGYGPTVLADEMMVMVIGQLVARTVPEVEPADEPKLGE